MQPINTIFQKNPKKKILIEIWQMIDKTSILKAKLAIGWEVKYQKRYNSGAGLTNWFLAEETDLDEDFVECLNALEIIPCKALDVGTGEGEQAIFLAQKGFKVTATDVALSAIAAAKKKAEDKDVALTFLVDDILFTGLSAKFDLITDRGCFTLINTPFKLEFLVIIKKLLMPGGYFVLKFDRNKSTRDIIANDKDFEIKFSKLSSYITVTGKIVNTRVMGLQLKKAAIENG